MLIKFFTLQIFIWLPLTIGNLLSKNQNINIKNILQKLIILNIIFIESFIAFWSIWGLKINVDMFILPIAGLFLVITGFFIGKLFSLFFKINSKQKATFIISSSLANHGFTMGSFLCYLFIGEKGLALSFIFLIYFMPYCIGIIFSYARYIGEKSPVSLKNYVFNIQNMPVYAIILAILLHLFHIKRPNINLSVIINLFFIFSITIYYLSMGSSLKIKNIFNYKIFHLSLFIIKFIVIPAITFLLLTFLNINILFKKIILIQSFMPAAIYSVLTSIIFNLDDELASNMFLINTVFFTIIVLPFLFYIIKFY